MPVTGNDFPRESYLKIRTGRGGNVCNPHKQYSVMGNSKDDSQFSECFSRRH